MMMMMGLGQASHLSPIGHIEPADRGTRGVAADHWSAVCRPAQDSTQLASANSNASACAGAFEKCACGDEA